MSTIIFLGADLLASTASEKVYHFTEETSVAFEAVWFD